MFNRDFCPGRSRQHGLRQRVRGVPGLFLGGQRAQDHRLQGAAALRGLRPQRLQGLLGVALLEPSSSCGLVRHPREAAYPAQDHRGQVQRLEDVSAETTDWRPHAALELRRQDLRQHEVALPLRTQP